MEDEREAAFAGTDEVADDGEEVIDDEDEVATVETELE